MKKDIYLVTCEHAGNRIPAQYRHYFDEHLALLPTHRAYDIGALTLARRVASALDAPLIYSTVTRLLIDLNRSARHPRLYSEATRPASRPIRHEIVRRHYLPYRNEVESHVADAAKNGSRLVHLSVHSFTPKLEGEVRNADIGLLYDPRRTDEKEFCQAWRAVFKNESEDWKVRMNYPYTGVQDALIASMKRKYSMDSYLGIQIEFNQKHATARSRMWPALQDAVIDTLKQVLLRK